MDAPELATVELAERVSGILREHGIENAMIGAGAMAVHGYIRSTRDLDFAVEADLVTGLERVRKRLRDEGLQVELRSPDPDDPLGGVLDIHGGRGEHVQIVNYHNDFNRGSGMLAFDAIQRADTYDFNGVRLRVVDLPHLIGLKVYAGGPKSLADILGLLSENPTVLPAAREVCARHGLGPKLDRLLAAADVE